MLTYTMDALRYREGALAAVWLSLGLTNLSLLFTTASLALERGILLSLLTAVCNGATLFMTGEVHMRTNPSNVVLLVYVCIGHRHISRRGGAWRRMMSTSIPDMLHMLPTDSTPTPCRHLGHPAVQVGAAAVPCGSCCGRTAAHVQQPAAGRCATWLHGPATSAP